MSRAPRAGRGTPRGQPGGSRGRSLRRFSLIRGLTRAHELRSVDLMKVGTQGKGMAERNLKNVQAAQAQMDRSVRETASGGPTAEIARAKELLEKGAISQVSSTRSSRRRSPSEKSCGMGAPTERPPRTAPVRQPHVYPALTTGRASGAGWRTLIITSAAAPMMRPSSRVPRFRQGYWRSYRALVRSDLDANAGSGCSGE